MAENPAESNSGERRFAEDLGPLEISVFPEGDPSGLHTQNDPRQPFQRDNIIERRSSVDIRCEHKDIAHGYYSDQNDDLCSLIVLEFRFSPNKVARRIKEAHVVIKFSAMQREMADPEVIGIYPNGSFCVEPSKQHEVLVRGAGINLGGGVAGAQIGGHVKLESTITREKSDATRVRGSIDLRDRNWGPKNSASWTFLENGTAESGVVSSIQVAILLKRRDMKHFKSTVTIRVSADVITKLGSTFKTDPKDDDIWYDPEREPTNRLQIYDIDNLGTFDIKSVCDVTYQTSMKGTVKEGQLARAGNTC